MPQLVCLMSASSLKLFKCLKSRFYSSIQMSQPLNSTVQTHQAFKKQKHRCLSNQRRRSIWSSATAHTQSHCMPLHTRTQHAEGKSNEHPVYNEACAEPTARVEMLHLQTQRPLPKSTPSGCDRWRERSPHMSREHVTQRTPRHARRARTHSHARTRIPG